LAAAWHMMTQQYDSLGDCLQAMSTTAHSSHGVHTAIASLTRAIQNVSSKNELSGVWTTAIRPLALYMDPNIAKNTNTSSIDLTAMQYGTSPMSLYLVAPSPIELERLHPLYRVVMDVMMTRSLGHPVRTWKHRLLICADELPLYGYVRVIDKGIAVWAGYGIKGLLVTQDFTSLEETYGERSAIWGNTDCKIFHMPNNDETAKRISENIMGKGTISNPVEQRQEGILGRRSVSMHHVGRPLLTTDEVLEMGNDNVIIRKGGMKKKGGLKPIFCQKVDYRVDRLFRRRAT
jgi:type IV secretion system protein VirD4